MERKSICQSLGLSSEWEEKNTTQILETLIKCDLVSEAVEKLVIDIKNEEFMVTDSVLTEYEKKLFWSGMELARLLMLARQKQQFNETAEKLRGLFSPLGTSLSPEDTDS